MNQGRTKDKTPQALTLGLFFYVWVKKLDKVSYIKKKAPKIKIRAHCDWLKRVISAIQIGL